MLGVILFTLPWRVFRLVYKHPRMAVDQFLKPPWRETPRHRSRESLRVVCILGQKSSGDRLTNDCDSIFAGWVGEGNSVQRF
jgi:hypothetical protein